MRIPTASLMTREAIMIFTLTMAFTNHVIIIPVLLYTAKRDAWLSTLFAVVPTLLWSLLVVLIMKRTNQQKLFPWLRERYGTIPAVAITLPISIFTFLLTVITVKDTAAWVIANYLPDTPHIFVSGFAVVASALSAYVGIRSIATQSALILPAVAMLGVFVSIANIKYKKWELLTPIFEHGASHSMYASFLLLGGLAEVVLLLMIQHHIKGKVNRGSVFLLVFIILGLTLGPTLGALTEFGAEEASKQRFPAFEQWKLVTIGNFIEHIDFFSVFQWLSGSYIRTSLLLFIICDMYDTGNKKTYNLLLLVCSLVLIWFGQHRTDDYVFLKAIKSYFLPSFMVVMLCITLILIFLTRHPQKIREESKNGEQS